MLRYFILILILSFGGHLVYAMESNGNQINACDKKLYMLTQLPVPMPNALALRHMQKCEIVVGDHEIQIDRAFAYAVGKNDVDAAQKLAKFKERFSKKEKHDRCFSKTEVTAITAATAIVATYLGTMLGK